MKPVKDFQCPDTAKCLRHGMCLYEKRPDCEHCSHPLWAGIKCSICWRWYDQCRICGKRGNLPCEECMKKESEDERV